MRRRRAVGILLVSSILRIVPETQAAERRTWNSKPSEETKVTNADGALSDEEVPFAIV